MRLLFAVLALAISGVLAACDAPESADSVGSDPAATVHGRARGPSDSAAGWGPPLPSPIATTITVVPVGSPTPIPRPFECEDHGYAGRADDDNSAVVTYWLTDPPEDPADAKYYVAQSICIAGMWVPPGNVQVWKAEYTLRQLEDWSDELRPTAASVPGRNRLHVNEGINRLEFWTATQRGKDLFERLLGDTSVPREAISIEVAGQMRVEEPVPNPTLAPGLQLSLDFDQVVDRNDPISFIVTATNTSETTFEIEYNPAAPVDIVIFTEDGDQIWKYLWGYVLPVRFEQLAPGESVEFVIEWDGLDDFRAPLDAGPYSARAYFQVGIPEHHTGGQMTTHPVPFQVLER